MILAIVAIVVLVLMALYGLAVTIFDPYPFGRPSGR